MYYKKALEKLKSLPKDYITMAIESSCDETAVALMQNGKVLSSIISSQIEIHKKFGGVVPEIASRNHVENIDDVVIEALEKAHKSFRDIDVVAVTYGAGLLGALLVGVSYAKSLAFMLGVPLMAIDHIKGHIFANKIENPNLQTPYIALLASGGHTAICKVLSYSNIEILGETQDDAVGEAFDKVARVLGLPYPGGPEIEREAKLGNNSIKLPRAYKNENHLNFSFSGLKTAVINFVSNSLSRKEEINTADVAKSFQEEATSVLVENTIKAAKVTGIKTITLSGGVAANTCLREKLSKKCQELGLNAIIPPKYLCTDNAAMIAMASVCAVEDGVLCSDLDLDADPSL